MSSCSQRVFLSTPSCAGSEALRLLLAMARPDPTQYIQMNPLQGGTKENREKVFQPASIAHCLPVIRRPGALSPQDFYCPSNRPQFFTSKESHILAAYSTASPISSPCFPSARSTSSSSYSPLMCGTLMVIRMSVFSFSSRRSVRIMAVKSGAEELSLD